MDERAVEKGYADFNRKLTSILHKKDVGKLKEHLSKYPRYLGKLSHFFGLSDKLIEVEMHKLIVQRKGLEDIKQDSVVWLKERGYSVPRPDPKRKKKKAIRRKIDQ